MDKANKLDGSRMHLEEFQRIIQAIDKDEARSCAYILVRRYPEIVMNETTNYISIMQKKINGLQDIVGGDE